MLQKILALSFPAAGSVRTQYQPSPMESSYSIISAQELAANDLIEPRRSEIKKTTNKLFILDVRL
jgi:hypothetical protein